MNIYRYLLIALALCFIGGFPYEAYSLEHIPFYVTNNYGSEYSLCCNGPWLRSGGGKIPDGAVDDNFYTVDVDIFSPYGGYSCGEYEGTGVCGDYGMEVNFTLEKGDTAVYLTINADASISVQGIDTSTTQARLAEKSDTSTTQATLGDDNTKPKRDRDTWSIHGTEGETVTVTLEEDPAAGHSGEQAALGIAAKGVQDIYLTDALPVEITTTLPSDGEYKLIVQQNDIPEDVRFRGRYFLSVKSSLGNVQDIKPSEDVEQ